jgi:hypothetical protein
MKKESKRRNSAKREEWIYVIEINYWDFSYMFAVNWLRNTIDGPYWEHTDLEMKGKIVHPEKLVDKEIEVTIMANRREVHILNKPEDYYQFEPKAVGGLTIRGKDSEFLGSVPFDAFHMLCSMIGAGKIKYLVLSGQALYRGSADIRSMDFQEHYGSEDIG